MPSMCHACATLAPMCHSFCLECCSVFLFLYDPAPLYTLNAAEVTFMGHVYGSAVGNSRQSNSSLFAATISRYHYIKPQTILFSRAIHRAIFANQIRHLKCNFLYSCMVKYHARYLLVTVIYLHKKFSLTTGKWLSVNCSPGAAG